MATLKLVKVTKKQTALFASLLVYFNRQRMAAIRRSKVMAKPDEYIHPISLQGIYDAMKCRSADKPIVKMAASVFFEQKFRGNSLTKKCSGWAIRKDLHVNGQLIKLLPELFEHNKAFIHNLSDVVMGSDKSVTLTTTFKFATEEQAQTFYAILSSMKSSDE